jgi:hypothetical protein
MPRRPNILYFITIGIAFTLAALVVSAAIEGRSAQAPLEALDTAPTTVILEATATPTPDPTPEPAPTPAPSGPPDRASCAQIRGTAYRSDTERDWFIANCT